MYFLPGIAQKNLFYLILSMKYGAISVKYIIIYHGFALENVKIIMVLILKM